MLNQNVQFLCAKIAGHWLGLDAKSIIEIATPGEDGVSELSDTGGTIEYHGKEIPAVYLTELLTGDKIRYHSSSKILITKSNGMQIGLVVDTAEEILRTSIDRVNSDNKLYEGNIKSELIDGIISSEDRIVHIVSLENISSLLSSNIEQ